MPGIKIDGSITPSSPESRFAFADGWPSASPVTVAPSRRPLLIMCRAPLTASGRAEGVRQVAKVETFGSVADIDLQRFQHEFAAVVCRTDGNRVCRLPSQSRAAKPLATTIVLPAMANRPPALLSRLYVIVLPASGSVALRVEMTVPLMAFSTTLLPTKAIF